HENGNDAAFWASGNGGIYQSAKGYIPEQVWNESCDPTIANSPCASQGSLFAGGGGLSTIYAQPSWQGLNITGLTGSGFTKRALPDVSLSAAIHDGYLICIAASCEPTSDPLFELIGGTSAS